MRVVASKPHFHVAAGLIWQDGKLLITKRPAGSHLAGLWEFPGGKKEDNENLEACLKREIMEELGIDILVDQFLVSIDHEYESKRITLHIFHCHFQGQPRTLEGQDAVWVALVDLKKYAFPPPDLQVIDVLLSSGFQFFL